jgi:hypothetical protein
MIKYFKPRSLTWWSSVTPLVIGIVIATEPLHGSAALADSMRNATGMTAPALINMGLAGVGLRAAVGT